MIFFCLPPPPLFPSPQLSDNVLRGNDIVSSRWAAREPTPSRSRIHNEYFAPLNDVEDIEQDKEILEEDTGDFDLDTSLGLNEDATHVTISKRLAGDEAPAVTLLEKPAPSFSFMNALVIIVLFWLAIESQNTRYGSRKSIIVTLEHLQIPSLKNCEKS
ncbi:hypothetical protein DL96DRAFT_1703908 [Flagelloscypha sp. PMI_526]|nr:hypothetical protein DL96DRAFT_1703908 [Flagelloscypha sp. PMI_526]